MASRTLSIVITGDASRARREMRSVEDGAGGMQAKLASVGRSLTTAGAGLTAGFTVPVVAGLTAATRAAIEDEKAQALLAQSLKKSGFGAQTTEVEKWITATQNATGVLDDELRPAFAKLVIAGRKPAEAMDDLGVALDIAAARGIPVATVVQAMSRAAQGNTTSLGKLGVAVKGAAGETLSYEQILAKAAKTMGGSAAVAAKTTEGRTRVLKARFADLTESIGAELLPVVEKVAGYLSNLAGRFSSLSPNVRKFAVIIAVAVAALGPLLVMIGSLVAAVGAIGLPVIAVVAAIGALVAAVVVAYNKVGWFRDGVNAAAGLIRRAFEGIVSWFRTNWPTIAATFAEVAELIQVAVARIRQFLEPWIVTMRALWNEFGDDVIRIVSAVFGRVQDTIGNALGAVRSIIKFVTSLLKGDWGDAWDAMRDVVSFVMAQIGNVLGGALDVLRGLWRGAWDAMRSVLGSIWDGIFNKLRSVFAAIVRFVVDKVNAVVGIANRVVEALPGPTPFVLPTFETPDWARPTTEGGVQRPTRDPDAVTRGRGAMPAIGVVNLYAKGTDAREVYRRLDSLVGART